MRRYLVYTTLVLFLLACQKNKLREEETISTITLNAAVTTFVDTVTLPAVISTPMLLSPDRLYLIDDKVFVNNGATLIIPAGTHIEGLYKDPNSQQKSALIITKEGQIMAKGTQSNPVVFTSSLINLPGGRTTRMPGDWGGIVLLGNAPTNNSPGNSPMGIPPNVDISYGGGNINHNAGVMSYCRIEFAGAPHQITTENAALTVAGVGKQTGLRNIMVSMCSNDAFDFLGGTVQPKYLVANSPEKNCFDFNAGYTGDIQFAVGVRKAGNSFSNASGIESSNNNASTTTGPVTRPVLSNFTIVGRCDAGQTNGLTSLLHLINKTDLRIRNSIFMGYPTGASFNNLFSSSTHPNFRNNIVHGFIDTATYLPVPAPNPIWGIKNKAFIGNFPTGIVNNPCPATHTQYKSSALVYAAGSPALQDTSYSGLTTNFLKVPYRGALGPGSPIRNAANQIIIPNNWIAGSAGTWVNFDPQ